MKKWNKKYTHWYTLLAVCLIFLISFSNHPIEIREHIQQTPEKFKARFETTKGHFDIEAQRAWSPKAVDRLYQLIQSGFYTDIAIYRVVPNYVAQFGLHNDMDRNLSWHQSKIPDEPVVMTNEKGTIAFVRAGEASRTTQLFINLKNNSPRLDTLVYNGVKGFPVVAKVTQGMDVVLAFYNGYGGTPNSRQDSIFRYGNSYLKKKFPKLDYIFKAYIIEE